MADDTDGADVDALRAEVAHLRALVGPSETAYRELAAAAEAGERAVREHDAELGRLRGQLAEMSVQLARARQEQEWALAGRRRGREFVARVSRRVRRAVGR